MNTNPAHDLFNLMFNLTRLRNKDKIIELFVEGMQEIFAPLIFNYTLVAEQSLVYMYEVRTRKSQYGVIVTEGPLPPQKELCVLIENAIQMLAVTLEHLDYEQILENERNKYEEKALKSVDELKNTVKDLQDSRTASINLIEDLSDEVEKRRETEKLLQNIVDNSNSLVYIVDTEGRFLMLNQPLLKLFSVPRDKLVGKTREVVLPKKIADIHRNNDLEVMKSGKTQVFEEENEEPDGKHYYLTTKFPLFNNQHSIYAVGGLSTDITERKKAEAALRESEDKFKYIFDHSLIGKSITSPSGEINVNKAFCDMLGYKMDEMEKTKWQDISHPDDIEMTQNILNSLISGEKESVRFIKRYIHKNGNIVWTDIGTALRRDDRGNPLYFLTTINDITERKQAEAELRLQSEIMSHMAEAVYLVRIADGIIVFTNSRFEELFGYGPGEMTGKHVSIVNAPDEKSPEATAKEIMDGLAENGNWKGEVKNIRKDGTLFWTSASVTIFDHSHFGKVLVAVQRDITYRKVAESRIKQLNEELELRVNQRTEQLQSANKELEAFSYSVSHDLRAPLRAIHSFTSILRQDYEKILDEEGNRICKIIETSSVHMGQLIDDLLAFSRVGRTGLEHNIINMQQLAMAVFSELTMTLEQKRITFIVDNLPPVSGDDVMMKQVFSNLISNAIKYSSKKETARIIIGSESTDNEVIYYVKDDGVGFDMQYSNKLFGVFQRLHSAKEFDGNGVGLAIVQRIIQRHAGRVWAEGEKDKGATFYFSLPVRKVMV